MLRILVLCGGLAAAFIASCNGADEDGEDDDTGGTDGGGTAGWNTGSGGNGATGGAMDTCPDEAPIGEACSVYGLSCSYEICCCGQCYPGNTICTCIGSEFQCMSGDACYMVGC